VALSDLHKGQGIFIGVIIENRKRKRRCLCIAFTVMKHTFRGLVTAARLTSQATTLAWSTTPHAHVAISLNFLEASDIGNITPGDTLNTSDLRRQGFAWCASASVA